MLDGSLSSDIVEVLEKHPFPLIAEVAGSLGIPAYVVGGFVRDVFLRRPSKDIDIVTVGEGSGIALAQGVANRLGGRLSVFRTFGTAQVKTREVEIEFVGARRESYNRDSRKPVVENGSLEDDLGRRDFTINAMAVSLNKDDFGDLMDPFNGMDDLDGLTLRTPRDADVTFDDDPLRMLRAVRFASQLGFFIHPDTFEAIVRNVHRLDIISQERVQEELNKIVLSPRPSIGFDLLDKTGLLELIIPELSALKGVETRVGIGHKDNFAHTLLVLDKVARVSDNLWLRWAALLHDIAKPLVKRWDGRMGWTFHNHEFQGQRMAEEIFRRLRLPLDAKLRYVQKLIGLHMRPINLSDEEITDSALRRLLFDAGEDLEDLFVLCEADITSKNPVRARRFLENYRTVRRKLGLIEEADRIRNFQPPVSGAEIMELFGLAPSPVVGRLKTALKDAVLDGKIPNEREAAREFLTEVARELEVEKAK
ncbi:MAG: CCA tRNA nucleotidyltransferase [Tannerellaceae bacterium]|jgi:tRNA nucleotidyltransferase/poly(A) polymerase|nr:CCA tRNA nucleotidyltransferase [Tannerellaceae bacterium]